ncbi:MAG: Ig-like domain repeat protein, partial [Acidimicrobiales bacterium]
NTNPAPGQLTQSGVNLGQTGAQVNVAVDNQQTTINQTIFQLSSNTATIQQPVAGSGQTTQTNLNAAQNSASVVVSGNNDTITIVQTIIQVAQNLGTTLVPHNGLTSAVGTTSQTNAQLGLSQAALAVSGSGNNVSISQGITQIAANQITQLQVNPTPAATPVPAASPGPSLQSLVQSLTPVQPQAPSTLSTSISPGTLVFAGTTVNDTATVTGSAPTGTVSFSFFTNGACVGSGAPAGTVTVTASSANTASAASNGETPTTAGSYAFIASYSGDSANAPSTSACEPLAVR